MIFTEQRCTWTVKRKLIKVISRVIITCRGRAGQVFRIDPSSALARRHTYSNTVTRNYCCRTRKMTLSFMDTLIALTYFCWQASLLLGRLVIQVQNTYCGYFCVTFCTAKSFHRNDLNNSTMSLYIDNFILFYIFIYVNCDPKNIKKNCLCLHCIYRHFFAVRLCFQFQ